MRYRNWQVGILLLLGLAGRLPGQPSIYEYYGLREGLSDRLVLSLTFDREGLLWVGTSGGLDRFDGYELLNFRSNSGQAANQQLTRARIQDIHLLADGRLALFYEDLTTAFDIFDPYSLTVRKVEVSLGKGISGKPRCLYVNAAGELFVLTRGEHYTGLFRYDPLKGDFKEEFRLSETWSFNYSQLEMLQLFDGRYLLYDRQNGLRLVSAEGEALGSLMPRDSSMSANPSKLNILHQGADGQVWVAFNEKPGVYRWNGLARELSPAPGLPEDELYENVWEDQQGNLLFHQARGGVNSSSETQGLYCRKASGEVVDFSYLMDVSDYFVSVAARDFFRSMFVGTDTGLKLAQNTHSLVRQYLAQDIGEDRRGYSMRNITGDGGNRVFFAREVHCWYQLNLDTEVLDTIFLRDDSTGDIFHFSCGVGLYYDDAGHLWGATCDGQADSPGRLHRYEPATCRTETYYYPGRVRAMERGEDGHFWLGVEHAEDVGELVFFDTITKSFIPYRTPEGLNPLKGAYPRYLELGRDGSLWVGTELGLVHLDPDSGEYTHYQQERTGSPGKRVKEVPLHSNSIYVIHEADDGSVWMGTASSLTHFDPEKEEWTNYTSEYGLAGETVCGILPDDRGALWVSTYNGLSYFDPVTEEARRFYRIDGFSHNEFNRFSFYRDVNGRYYFGGVNGINAFYSKELFESREVPKVLLTSFSRYNNRTDSVEVQYAGLTNIDELVIPPYYDYFSLDFALPIYTPTADNQFRYRIGDDEEQDWIYLDGGRSIRYSDLRPGRYDLQVQGSDPNGNWGKEVLTIRMVVLEVFYKTWWFISLFVLCVVGAVYFAARARAREQLRMERLRTQLASDLHDEVSGLLAGISLQSELLKAQVSEPTLHDKLQRIRGASQRAMSKMSDVIWSIDSRRDRMEDLISRMEEHADEVLLPINVRYELKVHNLERQQLIPATVRQDLYFIYKEAINNVAKHANASRVDIQLGVEAGQFEMTVRDDGVGFKEEDLGKRRGQGLSNLRMRAQRLHAHLELVNGQGTTIRLKMRRFGKNR